MIDHRMPAQKIGDALAEANRPTPLTPEQKLQKLALDFYQSATIRRWPSATWEGLNVVMEKIQEVERKLDLLTAETAKRSE